MMIFLFFPFPKDWVNPSWPKAAKGICVKRHSPAGWRNNCSELPGQLIGLARLLHGRSCWWWATEIGWVGKNITRRAIVGIDEDLKMPSAVTHNDTQIVVMFRIRLKIFDQFWPKARWIQMGDSGACLEGHINWDKGTCPTYINWLSEETDVSSTLKYFLVEQHGCRHGHCPSVTFSKLWFQPQPHQSAKHRQNSNDLWIHGILRPFSPIKPINMPLRDRDCPCLKQELQWSHYLGFVDWHANRWVTLTTFSSVLVLECSFAAGTSLHLNLDELQGITTFWHGKWCGDFPLP